MKKKGLKYYLKVSNPHKGTYNLLVDLCRELKLQIEEYWQKRDDDDIKLFSEPIYTRNFNHIVYLYSDCMTSIEFAKYIVQKYIKKIERLESFLS